MLFVVKERLREKPGRRPIVVVVVVDRVRVELRLVVEVEDRSAGGHAIAVRIITPTHLQSPEFKGYYGARPPISFHSCILSGSNRLEPIPAPGTSKQYFLNTAHSGQPLVDRIPAGSFEERAW